MNVCQALDEACRRFAERPALVSLRDGGERKTSYRELYDLALAFRADWLERGLQPGDRVAVLLDNSVALVASEWACLLGGFLWVALSSRWSAEEIDAVLSDCRPSLLLAGNRQRELARALAPPRDCRLEYVDEDQPAVGAAAARPRRWPAPGDPVRIRYTSGTAGAPKGAVLTRSNYDASVETVAGVLGPLSEGDVVVQAAPMTHASGAMLIPHLLVGARALLTGRFDAQAFIEQVQRYGGTAAFLVPTMLVRVLEALDRPERLSSLRTIVYGGASMPVDRLVRGLELLGPVFVQIYGLTESTWPVTALSKEDHLRRPGEDVAGWHARLASCGRPTAVGELRVVKPGGEDAAPGEAGEIWVRGRNTMRGYWGGVDDEQGKGLDENGWMHTGDVGIRDGEGYVTIIDRLHDMIVSGGFNVYPREVEHALSSHPGVLESAVVGRPHPDWGEAVHAFVVLRPGASATEQELIAHCGRHLAGYKKPKQIEFVDSLPKNASGKILRRVLRDRLRQAVAERR